MTDRARKGEELPCASASSAAYAALSSVRLTIFLLCLIAITCIVGTLIPQQAPAEEYALRYGEGIRAVFGFLGLTDVFHAFWFLGLTGLFALNLIICTLRRLATFLKSGREGLPSEKALSAMPLSFSIKGREIEHVIGLFKGYRVKREDRGAILEKGALSRYGVYIIHTSIVVILLGSLLGLLFGYRGSVTLAKGETKDSAVERDGRKMPLGFAVRLDDFKMDFYPGGEPKEYLSRIEIIDNGKTVARGDVRVNHPFSFKGTNIYQASYGADPVFLLDIGGKEVRLGEGSAYKQGDLAIMAVRFERSIHNFGPGVQIAYLEGGETKTTWFLKDVPRLAEKNIMGVPVRLKGIDNEFYTGLEAARDPGVFIVWTGFALILFGLYVNFFMYHRRIYVLETAEGLLVAGTSAKNREAFKEEFGKWGEKAYDVER
jgi:cytochrome c biogenesis protein